MTHEEMKDLYELYLLGVLEPESRLEIESHVAAGCDVCRRAVRQASLTNAMVMSFVPESVPPARLKKRLLAAIGVESRSWGWLAWAAVSACLLIAVSWFSLEAHRRSEELTSARRVLDIVNSPETRAVSFGAGPRGNVFINPKAGVLLIATNLPKLEPGRIFEMWVIPRDGQPKPAGLFRPDANGNARHVMAAAVDLAQTGAVAVTVEPEAGSTAPTSTPFLVAGL